MTKEKPLEVNYRLWVQEGEMTVEQCKAIHRGYEADFERRTREDPLFGIHGFDLFDGCDSFKN